MKKLITFFLLLVCSGLALADTSKHTDHLLNPEAVTHYTDMSIYYLTQIFGTVGNVLSGNSSQMMGQLFYKLNWGIFIVSGLVIGYAVVLGVVRMASEGITIAPGKSTLFSLLKLAIGVALIIPNGATGYSVLQDIVMKVVVQGVGLADSVWDHGLDYLDKGGVTWTRPDDLNPSSDKGNYHYGILNATNMDPLYGQAENMAPKIFQSAVCMIGSQDIKGNYYNMHVDTAKHRFVFPGLNDDLHSGSSCGYVSWDINKACEKGDDTIACASARGALARMIQTITPAAKKYYCAEGGSLKEGGVCQGASQTLDKDYYNSIYLDSAMSYFPAIQIYADMKANNAKQGKKDFIKKAKQEGWLMAGRYYWNVMQFTNQATSKKDLKDYTSSNAQNDVLKKPGISPDPYNFDSTVAGAASVFSKHYHDFDFDSYVKSLDNGKKPTSHNLIKGKWKSAAIGGTVIVPGLAGTLGMIINSMNHIGNKFTDVTKANFNPIQFLYELGQSCIHATLQIWIVGGVLIAGNLLIGSICAASNPYFAGASAMVDWVKPIIMLVATALWGAGFFLSYYIPIYPFMIFLFAGVGWFISVIEAMVAAPLVALGLAHPENHDLLGKAEQAMMLLLGVFIQPALLVIGMIAGIIFTYVTFEMLIYGFSHFMQDIMQSGSSSGGATSNILASVEQSKLYMGHMDMSGILVQPLLLVVFCTILYTLLTQSFSLVYLLRDNTMRWIGAPGSGLPNPEQLTGDTKGAMTSYAKQTGEAQGSVATNYGKAAESPQAIGGLRMLASSAGKGSKNNSVESQDGGEESAAGGAEG